MYGSSKGTKIAIATYNRRNCTWKFRYEQLNRIIETDKYKEIHTIDPYNSKKELGKRVRASKELKMIIDYFSRAWIDYDEILACIGLSAKEVEELCGAGLAFVYDASFYIEKGKQLIEEMADKPDNRFNSKEIKKELHLLFI